MYVDKKEEYIVPHFCDFSFEQKWTCGSDEDYHSSRAKVLNVLDEKSPLNKIQIA